MGDKSIRYKTDMAFALAKLDKAIARLGATELMQGGAIEAGDYVHRVIFKYGGESYKFIYSRKMAQSKGYRIAQDKDVAIANINAINDLAKIADRGIYDFGKMIVGFKALEEIKVPWFFEFMGFNTRPRNIMEVRAKRDMLVKSVMNPEKNPEDFKKLTEAYEQAQRYFGVE